MRSRRCCTGTVTMAGSRADGRSAAVPGIPVPGPASGVVIREYRHHRAHQRPPRRARRHPEPAHPPPRPDRPGQRRHLGRHRRHPRIPLRPASQESHPRAAGPGEAGTRKLPHPKLRKSTVTRIQNLVMSDGSQPVLVQTGDPGHYTLHLASPLNDDDLALIASVFDPPEPNPVARPSGRRTNA